jgi:hypothetical protein
MSMSKTIMAGAIAAFALAGAVTIAVALMLPLAAFGWDYLSLHRVYSFAQYAVAFIAFGVGGGIMEWAARKFVAWFSGMRRGKIKFYDQEGREMPPPAHFKL